MKNNKALAYQIINNRYIEISKAVNENKKDKLRFSNFLYNLSTVKKYFSIIIAIMICFIQMYSMLDSIEKFGFYSVIPIVLLIILCVYIVVIIVGANLNSFVDRTFINIISDRRFNGLDKYFTFIKGNEYLELDKVFPMNYDVENKFKIKVFKNNEDVANQLRTYIKIDRMYKLPFYVIAFIIFGVQLYLIKFNDSSVAYIVNLIYIIIFSIYILYFIFCTYIFNTEKRRVIYDLKNGKPCTFDFEIVKDDFDPSINIQYVNKIFVIEEIYKYSETKDIITIDNYDDLLYETILNTITELDYLKDDYLEDKYNPYSYIYPHMHKCIQLCVESLEILDEDILINELKQINETDYNKNIVSVSDSKYRIESFKTITGCNPKNHSDDYNYPLFKNPTPYRGNNKGIISDLRVRESYDYLSMHQNWYLRGKGAVEEKDYIRFDYMKYFHPVLVKDTFYGFGGVSTSLYSSKDFIDNKEFRNNNYISYQFILHNSENDNNLIYEDSTYYINNKPGNQLFYDNKLILSEVVYNILSKYLVGKEIEVVYNGYKYLYYICKPKKYTKKVVNQELSIFVEEYSPILVKNSFLIYPCIVGDVLEEKLLVGIRSSIINDYSLKDHKYAFIVFNKKVYNSIMEFDDLKIIKNSRGYSTKRTRKVKDNYEVKVKYTSELIHDYAFSVFKASIKTYRDRQKKMMKNNNRKVYSKIAIILTICVILITFDSPFITAYFKNVGENTLYGSAVLRLKYLLPIVLLASVVNYWKTLVVSPSAYPSTDGILHAIGNIPNYSRRGFKILNDELRLGFHDDKIMFELPLEDREKYVDREVYYNNATYALYGMKVDFKKAIEEGELFSAKVNEQLYLHNKQWHEREIEI